MICYTHVLQISIRQIPDSDDPLHLQVVFASDLTGQPAAEVLSLLCLDCHPYPFPQFDERQNKVRAKFAEEIGISLLSLNTKTVVRGNRRLVVGSDRLVGFPIAGEFGKISVDQGR